MKNMKIPVENNLNEILVELDRLGYIPAYKTQFDCISVFADTGGYFSILSIKFSDFNTTLAELKEM